MDYGARLERGRIDRLEEGGYIVTSLDREGIESLPLTTIEHEHKIIRYVEGVPVFRVEFSKYTVGDMVYFFIFRDGTGKIVCKA